MYIQGTWGAVEVQEEEERHTPPTRETVARGTTLMHTLARAPEGAEWRAGGSGVGGRRACPGQVGDHRLKR